MTRKILVIYLILTHIFILVILINFNLINSVKLKLRSDKGYQEITSHYREMLAYHKKIDGNIPKGTIIFIGDSQTQGLAVSAISLKSENFGIGKDTSFGVIKRIHEYQSTNRAKVVVITIGINDLKIGRKKEEIISNYYKIIKSIPISTKILFNSIHPINGTFSKSTQMKNTTIDWLNNELKTICAEYSNVYFLDISNLLKDYTGNLSNSYHTGDGVHLNNEGYKIWINSLNEKIKEICILEK